MIYDLIVIGLGPAGSTAALTAARNGLKVLAMDRAVFPRHKLCGGAISTRIGEALDFDLSPVIRQRVTTGILHFGKRKPLTFTLDKPFIYLVERPEFDHFLLAKAEQAGAEIHQGEALVSLEEADLVHVRTDQGSYRCRYLLGCDGALSKVRKALNPKEPGWKGFGVEEEVALRPVVPEGAVLIRFNEVPHGYGWLFPKGERISAGVVRFGGKWKGAKTAYSRFLSKYRLTPSSPQGFPLPVYSGSTAFRRAKGRIGLAGDAAVLAEDFLGEGIYFAVKSGKLASEAVAEAIQDSGEFDSLYAEKLEDGLFPELEVSRKLAKGVYAFPLAAYWMARLYPRFFYLYLESLTSASRCRYFLDGAVPRWVQKGAKMVYNLYTLFLRIKGGGSWQQK